MTKKRKHQEDFHKVKLKVGKKKPRLENATDTNFKTRSIHLPEQLREDGILPTNNRKLNIKDLLSQMNHYSAGVKQNALLGLKDLLSQYPFIIDAHLSSILSEIAAVFTDKDSTVRAAAISLLQFLAPKVRAEHILPFFPLVSAHLSSAMTHISEGIQEDSLKVLDILLVEYPSLLMDRSNVLLSNFVELISHQQLSKQLKNREKICWMLSVNPNRRVTSQQWRLNVLVRLRKFLQVMVEGSSDLEIDIEGLHEQNVNPQVQRNALYMNWQEHASGQQHIQLYENGGLHPRTNSSFRLRSLMNMTGSVEKGLSSTDNLKRFIQVIIPLLLDCWIEASPAHLTPPILGNLLEPGSQQLMEQVLNIIHLLWQLAKQIEDPHEMEAWLRANYLTDFKLHFMCRFPYSFQETVKHRKRESLKSSKYYIASSNNIDHLLLNLTLCEIMVSLATASTLEMDSPWVDMIRKFVIETLQDGCKLSSKQLIKLLRVAWRLLQIQINKVSSETLMKAVYTLYQQRNLLFPVRTLLLKFFSRAYQKEELNLHTNRSRSKVLTRWLAGLPQQLVLLGLRNPELSDQLIGTIYSAASRANNEILQSLQAAAPRIYDPLDGAVSLLPEESQKHLVQLVYFLPHLPGSLLSSLSRCCIMGKLSLKLSTTLIWILHMRSSFVGWKYPVQGNSMTDMDYFSFLFSTLTEREDSEHLQKRDVLWGACISVLTTLPRILRLMLLSLRVNRVCQEELPVLAQFLRLLMQHGQLRSHMMTNELLMKQIIKDMLALKSGETQEQWLTDLHYYFSIYLATHPLGSGATNTVY